MENKTASMNHGMIFTFLVALAFFSVGTALLHLPALWNNLIIFGVAFVMAGLVVILFIIPLVLFAVMVILMMPDIAHVKVDFLRVF